MSHRSGLRPSRIRLWVRCSARLGQAGAGSAIRRPPRRVGRRPRLAVARGPFDVDPGRLSPAQRDERAADAIGHRIAGRARQLWGDRRAAHHAEIQQPAPLRALAGAGDAGDVDCLAGRRLEQRRAARLGTFARRQVGDRHVAGGHDVDVPLAAAASHADAAVGSCDDVEAATQEEPAASQRVVDLPRLVLQVQDLHRPPRLGRHQTEALIGRDVAAGGRNRVAVRVPSGVAQARVERIDLRGRQRMLHPFRLVMPLAGRYPGPVGQVPLPHAVGPHEPERGLPSFVGQNRSGAAGVRQRHRDQAREQGRRARSGDLQPTGEAFQRAGAARPLAGVDVLDGILQEDPFAHAQEAAQAGREADPGPERHRRGGHQQAEDDERERGVGHGHGNLSTQKIDSWVSLNQYWLRPSSWGGTAGRSVGFPPTHADLIAQWCGPATGSRVSRVRRPCVEICRGAAIMRLARARIPWIHRRRTFMHRWITRSLVLAAVLAVGLPLVAGAQERGRQARRAHRRFAGCRSRRGTTARSSSYG